MILRCSFTFPFRGMEAPNTNIRSPFLYICCVVCPLPTPLLLTHNKGGLVPTRTARAGPVQPPRSLQSARGSQAHCRCKGPPFLRPCFFSSLDKTPIPCASSVPMPYTTTRWELGTTIGSPPLPLPLPNRLFLCFVGAFALEVKWAKHILE